MSIPDNLKKELEWFEDELKKMNEEETLEQPEKSEYLKSLDEFGDSIEGAKEELLGKLKRRPAPVRRKLKSSEDKPSLLQFIIYAAGTFTILNWLFPKK